MDEVVRRPREQLDQGTSSDETSNVANVFIPTRYVKEFGSRLRYLMTFYQVKVSTEESRESLGARYLVHVTGKEAGVNAVVAAVNQWALGCV